MLDTSTAALGNFLGVLNIRIGQNNTKLFATKASDKITATYLLAQRNGNQFNNVVSAITTVLVPATTKLDNNATARSRAASRLDGTIYWTPL